MASIGNRRRLAAITIIAAMNVGVAVLAQNIAPPLSPNTTRAALTALEYPVTSGDVTDRAYRVVGRVETDVRKATIFSRAPSQRHVYRELWERARRLGADGVVNATYGDSRVTALSWGARRAGGDAIRFLTDAEIAARDAAPPAQGD